MTKQAYDEKNEADYERYTALLHEAIAKISNDKTLKLKPSIAELVRLTGIHRNTISGREWPAQQLDAIKAERARAAAEAKAKKELEEAPEDPVTVLQNKLDNAQLELIYWFNLHDDMEKAFNQSDKRFREMRDARDHYKSSWEDERRLRLNAEIEIERLNDLIKTLSND